MLILLETTDGCTKWLQMPDMRIPDVLEFPILPPLTVLSSNGEMPLDYKTRRYQFQERRQDRHKRDYFYYREQLFG